MYFQADQGLLKGAIKGAKLMTPTRSAPRANVPVGAIAVVSRNYNLSRTACWAIVARVMLELAVTWLEKLMAESTTAKQLCVRFAWYGE